MDRILLDVPREELPAPLRERVAGTVAASSTDRFHPGRQRSLLVPAAWLVGLASAAVVALRAAILRWLEPAAAAERLVLSALAAGLLLGAVIAARQVVVAIGEARARRDGTSRTGLHAMTLVDGSAGLAVVHPDRASWVPRAMLPEPRDFPGADRTTRSVLVLVDDAGRVSSLVVPRALAADLVYWRDTGRPPGPGNGWLPGR